MNQVLTRYSEFLSRKRQLVKPTGFSVEHGA
jgi:hypothetical protein